MSVCYFRRSFLVIIHQQPTFRKNLREFPGFRCAVGPDPARWVRHLHTLLPVRRKLFVKKKLGVAGLLLELDKADGDENRTEFFEQPRRGPRENIRDMPVVVNRLSTIQDCVVCRSSLPAVSGGTYKSCQKKSCARLRAACCKQVQYAILYTSSKCVGRDCGRQADVTQRYLMPDLTAGEVE